MTSEQTIGDYADRQQHAYRTANIDVTDQAFLEQVAEEIERGTIHDFAEAVRGELDRTLKSRTYKRLARASVLTDMLQIIELEKEKWERTGKDALTGLPLRGAFTNRFARSVASLERSRYAGSREKPHHIGVVLIDIDNFKTVNDTYGHAAGDRVLREVAQRLRSTCRGDDLVARWGGEEFAVVLNSTDGKEGAMQAAERMRQSICSAPVVIGDARPLNVTASIGVIIHPIADLAPELMSTPAKLQELMVDQADRALYSAKHAGKDRVVFFGDVPQEAR